MSESAASLFDDLPIIDAYTREDALADGALVDVSKTAREAGYTVPVALTSAVHGDVTEAIPESLKGRADPEGRLWDLLWVGRAAFQPAMSDPGSRSPFRLHMPVRGSRKRLYEAVMVAADEGSGTAITIMRVDED